LHFFATAAPGTEDALVRELEREGVTGEPRRGGVVLTGELESAYRTCIWSRIANRVAIELARGPVESAEDLYELASEVEWARELDPDRTFAVRVTGEHRAIARRFAAQRVKDAIADRMRDAIGRRPDVDRQSPDVAILLHLERDAVLSIDLAGPLHQRGYRGIGAEAPLRETLAAGILEIARWHDARKEGAVLVDPMCGSGTLAVEAALSACDVAPALLQSELSRWRGHDLALHERLLNDARARRRTPAEPCVFASDRSEAAVRATRAALAKVGLLGAATLRTCDLEEVERPAGPIENQRGLVVVNPPYGIRLGEERELTLLYERLGDVLKQRFAGFTAFVFTGEPSLAKALGLRPSRRHVLFNGPVECRLLELPLEAVKTGARPKALHPEAAMFENRLRKNAASVRRWAEPGGIHAYRLYDADVPEYNVAVDWYDGKVRIEEHAPPRSVDPALADRRLRDAVHVVRDVLEVDSASISLRVRTRRSDGEQHERRGDRAQRHLVREGELRFLVNLEDYLDTGLFLDDRLLRAMLRKESEGKDFLNLFAYTCTASVASAKGGARSTTSVDLSDTYLEWGRANFRANEIDLSNHRFARADVFEWLERANERFDLVYLAPPTYSKSKRSRHEFEVERDHPELVSAAAALLRTGGVLYFTTNKRDFAIGELERGLEVRALGASTVARDFNRSKDRHQAFRITRAGSDRGPSSPRGSAR
jgi:23S rRNA (guanine2445-N2)-methyltransferase / 23S rRNA (guanine2069-N7)-methyltransferase